MTLTEARRTDKYRDLLGIRLAFLRGLCGSVRYSLFHSASGFRGSTKGTKLHEELRESSRSSWVVGLRCSFVVLNQDFRTKKEGKEVCPHLATFSIRPAAGRDIPAINEIYNLGGIQTTASFELEPRSEEAARAWYLAHGPAYPIFVAERDGEVIGWSSLSPYAPRPGYRYTVEDSVYVRADCRGQGVGSALMKAVVEAAAALGYRALVAKIADHNEASLALHRAAGFQPVGVLTAVGRKFGRWLDVDLLELVLPERLRPDD